MLNRTGGTGAYMRHDFDVLRLARHIFLLLCSNPANLPLYGYLNISSVKLYLVDGQTKYSAVAVDSQRSWIPDADEPKIAPRVKIKQKQAKRERRREAHFSNDGQHRCCHHSPSPPTAIAAAVAAALSPPPKDHSAIDPEWAASLN